MMKKNQLTLISIIVAAIVIVTMLLTRLDNETDTLAERPKLFPELASAINTLTTINVTSSDGDVTLQKNDDGWVVSSKNNFPANSKQIRELLELFLDSKVIEKKTSNVEKLGRLKLADLDKGDSGTKVILKAKESEIAALMVGKQTNGRNGQYVRKLDSTQGLLIDKQFDLSVEAKSWIVDSIVDINESEIVSVKRSHPKQSFELWKEVISVEPPKANVTSSGSDENDSLENDSEEKGTKVDVSDEQVASEEKTSPPIYSDELSILPALKDNEELAESYKLNSILGSLSQLTAIDVKLDNESEAENSESNEQVHTSTEFKLKSAMVITLNYWHDKNDKHWVSLEAAIAPDAEDKLKADVEKFNRQWKGWRYEISSYKATALGQGRDELVKIKSENDEVETTQ